KLCQRVWRKNEVAPRVARLQLAGERVQLLVGVEIQGTVKIVARNHELMRISKAGRGGSGLRGGGHITRCHAKLDGELGTIQADVESDRRLAALQGKRLPEQAPLRQIRRGQFDAAEMIGLEELPGIPRLFCADEEEPRKFIDR